MSEETTATDWKRILVMAVLLAGVTVMGDRALSRGLVRFMSESHNRFVLAFTGQSEAEILVLGDSRADRHFSVPQLEAVSGRSAMTLALGGISMLQCENLLRDYLERNPAPKLLILEATTLHPPIDRMGDLGLFTVYSKRLREQQKSADRFFYESARILNLLRLNNQQLPRVLAEMKAPRLERTHKTTITPERIEKILPQQLKDRPIDEENVKALHRIAALAGNRGIPLRVVLAPVLLNAYAPPQYQMRPERYQSLMPEGESLWDYSDLTEDLAHFRDLRHMNEKGTLLFLEQLQKDGFFNP